MATEVSEPSRTPRRDNLSSSRLEVENRSISSNSGGYTPSAAASGSYFIDSSVATGSLSSGCSLRILRDTLPENTKIYDFAAIRSATNNFLGRRLSTSSASSQSWRCTIGGKDVVVFQRKLRKSVTEPDVRRKLALISRSHYTSIVKLLGCSISGEHIYLVYEFERGTNLGLCLRNKLNPDFTVLSSWMSRMQIATDVAHGLDYIHNTAGLSIDMVHKHVKSSGIIVTEPSFNAKICHFGASELCGDTDSSQGPMDGIRGYMSPEFTATGVPTQKSDVYAFGVVLLELMSGQEPLKLQYDRSTGNYLAISLVDTAKSAVGSDGGLLRRWMDRRLRDSFPVEVAEKLLRVALQCVEEGPDKRPDMKWVAGKISKLYLTSKIWSERVRLPSEISVSLGPR